MESIAFSPLVIQLDRADNPERFIAAVGTVNAKEWRGSPAGSVIVTRVDCSYLFEPEQRIEILVEFSRIDMMHGYHGKDGECTCGKNQCVYPESDFGELFDQGGKK